jgi:predicted RecA/RadA family phage recombinase
MAKNFVQPGEHITVPASGTITSGDVVVTGSLVGVAITDATTGQDVAVGLKGVYELPKEAATAMTMGARCYWITGTKKVSLTASGNTFLGYVAEAVAGSAATVKVLLSTPGE